MEQLEVLGVDVDKECKHCGQVIEKINYALGEEWMHVVVWASFPTVGKGTLWRHCKRSVAEPKGE